jgi:hypothetical protein
MCSFQPPNQIINIITKILQNKSGNRYIIGPMEKDSKDRKPYGSDAFELAADKLTTMDGDLIASRCRVKHFQGELAFDYFGDRIVIRMKDASFDPPSVSLYEKILLMHYVTADGSTTVGNNWKSFKDLPGGMFYQSAYKKRATDKLDAAFGDNPQQLRQALDHFGAEPGDVGDVSGIFHVLPAIEVNVILYEADDEFSAEGNILYREDIVNFLPLEDIAVLGGLVAGRLKAI